MKSKASIDGHAIHPILISFPVAFFTGTLFFDILGSATGNRKYATIAKYMAGAGVVCGLVAAVPGIIDYLYTVPPRSSAKKRATSHGILNVSMVSLFALSWFMRKNKDSAQPSSLMMEAAGFVMMCSAGWMGGTLVSRNQIGIYNRYASGGKWMEAYLEPQNGWIEAAAENELKPGQMKLVHVDQKRIVVAHTDKGYQVFDDRCTHKGGSLAAGVLIGSVVQCPWHGSQFNCSTGRTVAGPAEENIATYNVINEGGKIMVEMKEI